MRARTHARVYLGGYVDRGVGGVAYCFYGTLKIYTIKKVKLLRWKQLYLTPEHHHTNAHQQAKCTKSAPLCL